MENKQPLPEEGKPIMAYLIMPASIKKKGSGLYLIPDDVGFKNCGFVRCQVKA